jgi:hypothetical protein
MGLHDYPQYVKHPMDLSTIHRKLREQRYRLVEEVLDDFQLIWDNCKCYNPPNSVPLFPPSGSTTWQSDWTRPTRRWSSPTSPTLPSPRLPVPPRTRRAQVGTAKSTARAAERQ